MAAIQAATSVPARVMGLIDDVGTVEVGKRADLVIVAGDPLADIHAIRDISLVVAHGEVHEPAGLWRLAEFEP
jgi:imidazolonepropionase-like amidohydrolase